MLLDSNIKTSQNPDNFALVDCAYNKNKNRYCVLGFKTVVK